jgi:hypothetical protein
MRKRMRVPVLISVGLFAVLAAAAAFSSAEVSFRSAERDGARVAEILIGERPVIVLRTSAAGYSPLERAEIVANRLRSSLASEVSPDQVRTGSIAGGTGLYIRDQLIVAVYAAEADAQGATQQALATVWRDNIITALGYEPPKEAAPPAEQAPEGGAQPAAPAGEQGASETQAQSATDAKPAADSVDWTGVAQKWVPVLSLERQGARIGMAQIAGPTAQVERVKAVYEVRLDFKSIGRIYAYVPVSKISLSLDRVQGVSVWALADIRVLGF